jgi:hypothetical protein
MVQPSHRRSTGCNELGNFARTSSQSRRRALGQLLDAPQESDHNGTARMSDTCQSHISRRNRL